MDVIEKLQHDHAPLSESVRRLERLVAEVRGGSRTPADVHADFLGTAEHLEEELLEHFGEEEETTFPFLSQALPDLEPTFGKLSAAHDQICGALSRTLRAASRGPEAFAEAFDHVASLVDRFGEAYAQHAEEEVTVLEEVAARLSPEERRRLGEEAESLF